MTRKDYELIAQTIRNSILPTGAQAAIAGNLAVALRATNPRFDSERFVKACGA